MYAYKDTFTRAFALRDMLILSDTRIHIYIYINIYMVCQNGLKMIMIQMKRRKKKNSIILFIHIGKRQKSIFTDYC